VDHRSAFLEISNISIREQTLLLKAPWKKMGMNRCQTLLGNIFILMSLLLHVREI
jgi:hypothetical protein